MKEEITETTFENYYLASICLYKVTARLGKYACRSVQEALSCDDWLGVEAESNVPEPM